MNLAELKEKNKMEEEAEAAETDESISSTDVNDDGTDDISDSDDVKDDDASDGSDGNSSEIEPWQETETQESDDVPVATHVNMKRKLKGRISERDDKISELEAKIEALQQRSAPVSVPKIDLPVRPLSKNFSSEDEYEQALSEYESKLVEVHVNKAMQTKSSTQTVEERKKALDKSVDDHYTRAEGLVKESGIKPDVYKAADETVRKAVEEVRPNFGDLIIDQLISVLGEGSEKVMYYVGRNPSALEKTVNLLTVDPSGMKAAIFLGQQKERLTSKVKRKSSAPNPAPRVEGDSPSGDKAKALREKYNKAHKKGNLQEAYDIKKRAKTEKINVTNW